MSARFMHAPLLQSLVCTALMLTDAALHALAGLRELRLLGLQECSASVSGLLGCVSRLHVGAGDYLRTRHVPDFRRTREK